MVTPQDIPALRDECVRVFREAFGETLDLDDFEGSSAVLSGRRDQLGSLELAIPVRGGWTPGGRDSCPEGPRARPDPHLLPPHARDKEPHGPPAHSR
jgi:hypothetical protein